MTTAKPKVHRIPVVCGKEYESFLRDIRPGKIYRNLICREFVIEHLGVSGWPGSNFTLCMSLEKPAVKAVEVSVAYLYPYDDEIFLYYSTPGNDWADVTEAIERLLDECFDIYAIGPKRDSPLTGYIWLEARA